MVHWIAVNLWAPSERAGETVVLNLRVEGFHASIAVEDVGRQQYWGRRMGIVTVLELQRRPSIAQSAHQNINNDRMANRIYLYLALGGNFREPEPATQEVALNQ